MDDEQQPNLAALIVAQTVDGVIDADAQGVIRLWNAAAEQILGKLTGGAIELRWARARRVWAAVQR